MHQKRKSTPSMESFVLEGLELICDMFDNKEGTTERIKKISETSDLPNNLKAIKNMLFDEDLNIVLKQEVDKKEKVDDDSYNKVRIVSSPDRTIFTESMAEYLDDGYKIEHLAVHQVPTSNTNVMFYAILVHSKKGEE